MADQQPLISVVCCTHNRESFARSHFESLRPHLGEHIELIYALDNCTDGTSAALETLAVDHPQVRVLQHQGERGLFNCRNFGLSYARGAYIHFLDDDDSVEPGFYAQACEGLRSGVEQGIDLYLARLRITTDRGHDAEREVLPADLMQKARQEGPALHLKGDLFEPILNGRLYFNGANSLYSAALLRRYGYRQELKKSADWLFTLEIGLRQPLHLVFNTAMLANYYVHSNSMSIAPDKALWNARVFDMLLEMSHHRPEWKADIRRRCAQANFDAGYALRGTAKARALSHYWRAFQLAPSLRPLTAMGKLNFN